MEPPATKSFDSLETNVLELILSLLPAADLARVGTLSCACRDAQAQAAVEATVTPTGNPATSSSRRACALQRPQLFCQIWTSLDTPCHRHQIANCCTRMHLVRHYSLNYNVISICPRGPGVENPVLEYCSEARPQDHRSDK